MSDTIEQTAIAPRVESPAADIFELLERLTEANRRMAGQVRNGTEQINNLREIITVQNQRIEQLGGVVAIHQGCIEVLDEVIREQAAKAGKPAIALKSGGGNSTTH